MNTAKKPEVPLGHYARCNTPKRTPSTPATIQSEQFRALVTLSFDLSRGHITFRHDRERSLTDFPREWRTVGRPFCAPQRIAQPPVLSVRAGLAANAGRREARRGTGRESPFVGSGDGCLPRYGRPGAR